MTQVGYNWTCPHCNRAVTITEESYSEGKVAVGIRNRDGLHVLEALFIVCPNPDCHRYTLTASLYDSEGLARGAKKPAALIRSWSLIPPSSARSFPSYVPKAVVQDYEEACLIKDLSPKAAATLARRCLQGVIRDFWKVKPGHLANEIEEIKPRVDLDTWEAIDSVRKVGNIGAHMEKDINIIIDVDPNEAALLIQLIETLIQDWYVARESRKTHLEAIARIAKEKDAQKSPIPKTK